ncbi:MAG: riboflavin synthase, partial [Candidatus Lambdaproteobacteria bacterium]|nr:riboflavin synthase [Candidatus Lambdaproteobacteria bacterium]
MFTGIVEEVGEVVALAEREGGWHLTVRGRLAHQGTRLGDSVAVNGACLTVTHIEGAALSFGLAPET